MNVRCDARVVRATASSRLDCGKALHDLELGDVLAILAPLVELVGLRDDGLMRRPQGRRVSLAISTGRRLDA